MNTTDTHENLRPLGFWLKTVDRLLADEFARAFEAEGASRRDWRMLNVLSGAAAPYGRLAEHKLHRLIERGWVATGDDGFVLTEEGRAATGRLGEIATRIRARVTDAVPEADLAIAMGALEKIARAFGWNENDPMPHRRAGRRPRHPHHAHSRGESHGFGPHRHGNRAVRIARFGQRSYERGFDAGFSRGRDA